MIRRRHRGPAPARRCRDPAFHWGVIWVPRVIADYQVTVAHACIDAGADLVLGHHAHVPKAIEVYKGKGDLLQPQ
jgi:hypothetical protein